MNTLFQGFIIMRILFCLVRGQKDDINKHSQAEVNFVFHGRISWGPEWHVMSAVISCPYKDRCDATVAKK